MSRFRLSLPLMGLLGLTSCAVPAGMEQPTTGHFIACRALPRPTSPHRMQATRPVCGDSVLKKSGNRPDSV